MANNTSSPPRLADLSLVDALDTLKRRAWGLEAAVSYLADNCPDDNTVGVSQLAFDFAAEIDRLAEAFSNEHACEGMKRERWLDTALAKTTALAEARKKFTMVDCETPSRPPCHFAASQSLRR